MLRKMTLTISLLVAFQAAFAEEGGKIAPDQRYLLLATSKTGTMQKELDGAAAQGFRVLAGSPTSGAEMVLFLERVAQPPDTYEYRILATTKTSTMERELGEAAREGFRLVPQTAIAKEGAGGQFLGGSKEIVLVMERTPNDNKHYEYKLLATTKTSTMQKEVGDAVASNFVLVGLLSRDEHLVVMERQTQ